MKEKGVINSVQPFLAPKKPPTESSTVLFCVFQKRKQKEISDSVLGLLALSLCIYLEHISSSVQNFHTSMKLHYRTSYSLCPMPQLRLYMFRVVPYIHFQPPTSHQQSKFIQISYIHFSNLYFWCHESSDGSKTLNQVVYLYTFKYIQSII